MPGGAVPSGNIVGRNASYLCKLACDIQFSLVFLHPEDAPLLQPASQGTPGIFVLIVARNFPRFYPTDLCKFACGDQLADGIFKNPNTNIGSGDHIIVATR